MTINFKRIFGHNKMRLVYNNKRKKAVFFRLNLCIKYNLSNKTNLLGVFFFTSGGGGMSEYSCICVEL